MSSTRSASGWQIFRAAFGGLFPQSFVLAMTCVLLLSGKATAQESAAASGATIDRLQDNVVVLLDTSGSMGQWMPRSRMTRMDAAKQALRQVVEQLPDSTNLGLLIFSPRPSNAWQYPLGTVNKQQLLSAVDRLRPYGGTPLGAYMKVAADRLLHQRATQQGYGTYRLLIISDGQATDQYLVDSYLPDVLARGITIDVIGVDMNEEHALATRVHSYRKAGSAAQLQEAVQRVFAEVGSKADDTGNQAEFDLIAPLPEETARGMLQALATSGNHPIGTRIDGGATVPVSLPPLSPSPPTSQPGAPGPSPSYPPSGAAPESGFSALGGPILLGIIVVIFLIYMNHEGKVRRRIRR